MEPIIDKRPWGEFARFTHNEPSTVKLIRVEPHQEFSLQYHDHRKEFWRILSGRGTVRIGEETLPCTRGDEFTIVEHTPHRVSAGDEAVEFLEISFGDFDENDIVRLEDKYGRASHA